jgi:outer membrane protein OmpA-like peptidoglycan-associated protein/tetratricopeptide (TPR) repeat protein
MIRQTLSLASMLCLLLVPIGIQGQTDRADRAYEEGRYEEALHKYQRAANAYPDNSEISRKIGSCFAQMGEYDQAKRYLRKSIELDPENRESELQLAATLLRTMKLDSAQRLLESYLGRYPEDSKAHQLNETINYINRWKSETLEAYTITQVRNINTSEDELSPVMLENSLLVFTSNRDVEIKDFSGVIKKQDKRRNIYGSLLLQEDSFWFDEPELLDKNLDSGLNNGPISFWENASIAYMTVQREDSVMMIKQFEKKEKSWEETALLPINNPSYNVKHPFVTPNGKYLFFSSDMPGGYGKFDLYIVEREGETWSKPRNLGPKVNTPENEAFPTYYDSVVYFASNGHPGFGGMDIYSAKPFYQPTSIHNMGFPINSSSDDFHLFFNGVKTGFFTSNRPKGSGGDDIYAFSRKVIDPNTTSIRGVVEYNNFPAGEMRVDLVNKNQEVLQTIVTNKKGEFEFEGIDVNAQYSFILQNDSGPDTLNTRFYMLNSNGEKVVVLLQNLDGEFEFNSLPAEKYDNLPLLEESSDLLTVELKGQVFKKKKGDLKKRIVVYVLNEQNLVIAKGYTDKEGNFSISNLPPKEQYRIRIADKIEDAQIVILEEGDRIIVNPENEIGDEFIYRRLNPDENFITVVNESGEPVKIKLNENFTVENIYYDFNSWEINETAKDPLNRLASMMLRNPHISIALISHTDSRASDEFNLELSQKRAEEARNFLIERGVESRRISAIGKGETQLANHCDDRVECSEIEHAENRRTEFIIKAEN